MKDLSGRLSIREEATTIKSPGAQSDIGQLSNTDTVPGDFEDLMEMVVLKKAWTSSHKDLNRYHMT